MGLDVYLKYCKDWEKYEANQKLYEEGTNKIWETETGQYKDYNSIPKEIRDSTNKKCKDFAISLGFTENGDDLTNECQTIELSSKKYPEHYFKIGYFRSSYNPGGINSVIRDLLGDGFDLYYIFERNNEDEYYFKPEWNESLLRTRIVRKKLKKEIKKSKGFSCFTVDSMFALSEDSISSKKKAMELFLKELGVKKSFYGAFTNKHGYFSLDKPIEVYAIIQGKGQNMFTEKQAESYIIYKTKSNHYKWYIQALDIVEETIKYVLAQPDQENYRLAWSS